VSTQTWTVAEAKAKFSEVLDKAQNEGPQRITRHGRTTAMVVAAKEWDSKANRKGSLAKFFASSPLKGAGVKTARLDIKLKKTGL
jgi:prevent-host-death family protein